MILTLIWLFAILLASPMIFFKRLIHHDINLHSYGIDTVSYCIEDWPIEHGRAYYSAFSLFFQYLLPILIVTAAYSQIYDRLRNRISAGVVTHNAVSERNLERGRRMRRTNCLLFSIAIIFGISWLPLNIFNLYSDICLTNRPVTQPIMVAYAVCHMIGMSSACSNPLLYGWLNENFRKEFKEILCRQTTTSNVNEIRRTAAEVTQIDTGAVMRKNKSLADGVENGMVTEMSALVR